MGHLPGQSRFPQRAMKQAGAPHGREVWGRRSADPVATAGPANRHERPGLHGTCRHCTRVMPRASNAYAYPYAHCGLNPHPSVTGASSPLPHARSGPKGDRRHAAPLPPLLQAGRSEGVPRQVQEARLVVSSRNKQNLSKTGPAASPRGVTLKVPVVPQGLFPPQNSSGETKRSLLAC